MRKLKNLVKQVLTEKENKRYEKLLSARCISYDRWVWEREKQYEELPVTDACESEEAQGIKIFHMPCGRLAEHAVAFIQEYFVKHPEVQIVYGDEDVWQGAERNNPWYKPDWSPDLFDSWYYFGSVVAVRSELGASILSEEAMMNSDAWSVEELVANVRKCLEACGGWQRGCKSVGHVPGILFHCDSVESQMQYMQWETKAVIGQCEEEKWGDGAEAQLSIVIPSKDNPDILEKCVQAIAKAEKKLNYELIIVDNGSSEDNKKKIENMLQAYARVKYIYRPMEFNFSKMCNLGAENAVGRLLLFLNDDVELVRENCLSELAKLAMREYAGAVGMKLYYPNSDRIQHAGITNLPMGPVHKLQFLEDDRTYYFNTNRGMRNVLAVTAACLMVEKKKFLEVQGFAEDLQVAFNDVDFCFKLYEQGYYNVCNNECYAFHHESLSRGDDESTEKWLRLLKERDMLYAKHPALEGKDPYYGEGLGREGLDTRVRPEYETAGNKRQELCGRKEDIRKGSLKELEKYRQDNCLMLRVENCRQGVLQGYGVVLGDNNACYEKGIVLEAIEAEEDSVQQIYTIPMEGQYRPDLLENMPDQINVGLSGFWITTGAKHEAAGDPEQACLPQGSYRIGMTARNRVTGLKLINWSSRILMVK